MTWGSASWYVKSCLHLLLSLTIGGPRLRLGGNAFAKHPLPLSRPWPIVDSSFSLSAELSRPLWTFVQISRSPGKRILLDSLSSSFFSSLASEFCMWSAIQYHSEFLFLFVCLMEPVWVALSSSVCLNNLAHSKQVAEVSAVFLS